MRYNEGEITRVATTYLTLLGERRTFELRDIAAPNSRDLEIAAFVVPAIRELMTERELTEFKLYRERVTGSATLQTASPQEPVTSHETSVSATEAPSVDATPVARDVQPVIHEETVSTRAEELEVNTESQVDQGSTATVAAQADTSTSNSTGPIFTSEPMPRQELSTGMRIVLGVGFFAAIMGIVYKVTKP